jgi:hypothetical protein
MIFPTISVGVVKPLRDIAYISWALTNLLLGSIGCGKEYTGVWGMPDKKAGHDVIV